MKITRIELWHVAVPTPAPFHPSWIPGFSQTENRFTLVRLFTRCGLEGVSAAQSMGTERAGLGALLGPYLLGERADDIPSIRQRIREMSYLGWRVGWLEIACWDILGKACGKPIYELLGGKPGKIQLYASTGEVKQASLRSQEVEARAREGFKSVKLRVHEETLEADIAQIRDTRMAVGDDIQLGVDCNQAWRVAAIADAPRWDYDRALRFCKAAEEARFAWVEEPLAMEAYDALRTLRKSTDVDITGGELNSSGLPEFETMIERGCYDAYQPDCVFTGGIAESWAIVQRIKQSDARYSPHTWTNGIGFAANMHLFAAVGDRNTGKLEYPYNPPGWVESVRDGVLKEPWLHEGGTLQLPTAPGLGLELDLAALRRHGRRYFTATAARVAVNTVRDRGIKAARALGATRSARLKERACELDRAARSPEQAARWALGEVQIPRPPQS